MEANNNSNRRDVFSLRVIHSSFSESLRKGPHHYERYTQQCWTELNVSIEEREKHGSDHCSDGEIYESDGDSATNEDTQKSYMSSMCSNEDTKQKDKDCDTHKELCDMSKTLKGSKTYWQKDRIIEVLEFIISLRVIETIIITVLEIMVAFRALKPTQIRWALESTPILKDSGCKNKLWALEFTPVLKAVKSIQDVSDYRPNSPASESTPTLKALEYQTHQPALKSTPVLKALTYRTSWPALKSTPIQDISDYRPTSPALESILTLKALGYQIHQPALISTPVLRARALTYRPSWPSLESTPLLRASEHTSVSNTLLPIPDMKASESTPNRAASKCTSVLKSLKLNFTPIPKASEYPPHLELYSESILHRKFPKPSADIQKAFEYERIAVPHGINFSLNVHISCGNKDDQDDQDDRSTRGNMMEPKKNSRCMIRTRKAPGESPRQMVDPSHQRKKALDKNVIGKLDETMKMKKSKCTHKLKQRRASDKGTRYDPAHNCDPKAYDASFRSDGKPKNYVDLKNLWLLIAILFVKLQLSHSFHHAPYIKCPQNFVPHGYLCCSFVRCIPGYQVKICSTNFTADTCEQCPDGTMSYDETHSEFNFPCLDIREECPSDTIPVSFLATDKDPQACSKRCQCNTTANYCGTDPCNCRSNHCKKHYHLRQDCGCSPDRHRTERIYTTATTTAGMTPSNAVKGNVEQWPDYTVKNHTENEQSIRTIFSKSDTTTLEIARSSYPPTTSHQSPNTNQASNNNQVQPFIIFVSCAIVVLVLLMPILLIWKCIKGAKVTNVNNIKYGQVGNGNTMVHP